MRDYIPVWENLLWFCSFEWLSVSTRGVPYTWNETNRSSISALFPSKYPKQKSPSTEKPLSCSFKKSISKSLNVVGFWSSSMAKSSGKGKLGLRSHYSPNQKLGSQKIFEKLKPQPEEPTNVTQFLSRTTEIHKYVKINTVDQISFLARIVR